MSSSFLIIDGHSLAFRAFYAYPANLTGPQGKPINAVYGFVTLMCKAIDDFDPNYVCVCFDHKQPTFRHETYEAYKAHRPPAPPDFIDQMNLLYDLLTQMNIPQVVCPGYEADDIIGTLAKSAEKQGQKVFIMTGDHDALQLVTPSISVVMSKKSELKIFTPELVQTEYGFVPERIVDFKALKGDSSDNIPGVKGIGDKTAQSLLQQFGTLDGIYQHLNDISSAKVKATLTENQGLAELSYHLATICTEAPVETEVTNYRLQLNWPHIVSLFETFRFTSLAKKYSAKQLSEAMIEPSKPIAKLQPLKKIHISELPNFFATVNETLVVALGKVNGGNFEMAFSNGQQRVLVEVSTGNDSDGLSLFETASESTLPVLISALKPILANHAVILCCYNVKALTTLLGFLFKQDDNFFDVQLAEYLVTSGEKAHFEQWCAVEGLEKPSLEDLGVASLQLEWIERSFRPLMQALDKEDMTALLRTIEQPLALVLADVEAAGVTLNLKYLAQLSADFQAQLQTHSQRILELAGVPFNLNSPKQLSEVLYDTLGLPVYKKTKTGRSTDSSVLEKLKVDHPIAEHILKYRTFDKLLGTYINVLPQLTDSKHKLHSSFSQVIAATGRLSSSNPNLQNIPVRTPEGQAIRKAFIPSNPDGFILSVDYSQVELRILAHLCGDKNLLEAFQNNLDIHQSTAAIIYNLNLDQVSKEQRYHAKAVNFGIIYGISAFGLSENLDIPRAEAQTIIDDYFAKFPAIKQFIESTLQFANSHGYVTTEFGRKRVIPNLKGPFHLKQFAERTAVNTRIQGTAADIMKLAMLNVQKALENSKLRSKMIIQVHDELVFDGVAGEEEPLQALVKQYMESVVSWSVPLKVDSEFGKNWQDLS